MIWIFYEPINKFEDLDLQFWEFGNRNDTRCQVQGPEMSLETPRHGEVQRVHGYCMPQDDAYGAVVASAMA